MGDNALLRNALHGLGFSNDAAACVVDTQGFVGPEDFALLASEEASNVCKVTRRPRGALPNGDPQAGNTVSITAENNLKLLCCCFRHKERTSRPCNIPLLAQARTRVRAYAALSQHEADHEDQSIPEIKSFSNWTRIFDVIEDHLRECLGTAKTPLAWIVREDRETLPDADDPADDHANHAEELIVQAPHHVNQNANPLVLTQAHKDDNIRVFNVLAQLFRDKDCWTCMQHASQLRDGRAAYHGLRDHCLGPDNVDNLANSAERKLQNTTCNGEQRHWNFEQHVCTHVDQHQIISDLTRHGHAGIDDRSKVRCLVDGIKTKELDHVKTQIAASSNLRSDFHACVHLFKTFIKQNTHETRNSNVSAVKRGPNHNDGNQSCEDVEADMSVEDRHCTKKECDGLSLAKKKGLSIKRSKRGHKKGSKDSKASKGGKSYQKSGIKSLKKMRNKLAEKVEELAANRNVSAIRMSGTENTEDSDTACDSNPPQPRQTNNRKNKALKRKSVKFLNK